MKVMVIAIVSGALETIPKRLLMRLKELEIGRQTKTIQTTALLKSVRILKRVLKI